ncbi:NAD-dependent succinate-semialdehyde dehydrogenase [Mycetocola miduiensis]|uniref:Succinate semialdehyde dehydrogenase n=1 Tax=Mycetocola miduiensis TaxID=995034 RepID=A0A1I5AHV3_9MICO|nr:NAD-dependent succinate-semialdehyde dehydrogenase [Mycetocola miduiensis]SFN62008.1 succinate semialdehyde dehydrogenase [Mycetocola miduiensis]
MTNSNNSSVDIAGAAIPTGLFIDGTWRPGENDATFDVISPASGAFVASVADASVSDALDALGSADRAQASWGRTSGRERAEILRAAFDLIRQNRDVIAAVTTAEMGRPIEQSLGEVDYGGEFFRWFSEQAAHLSGDFGSSPRGDFDILTTKVPVGPSLLITPWNFPLAMGTRKIGAALAAGCTVVIKPAAQTPLTMALLVRLLAEAGVPAGVVNFVPTSDSAPQSEALMADSRLRKVSFTGSTGVGIRLLQQAAPNVLRSSMELGGNGPFLVFDDANLDAALDGAMLAKFRNGGQSCVAANRFIVQRAVADEFIARLVERTQALAVGDGATPGMDVGPLIDARQLARVQNLVDDAIAQGATVLTGGKSVPGNGHFFEPTVLVDVPPHADIANEEIFGPVAVVSVVDSDDEAIAAANDTPYGLAAFLYSDDVTRAFNATSRIEAGMIGVNRGLVSEVGAPFGGVKASGLGREGGKLGIEEYLETKYIALARLER